ncbi:peptidoglycan/xylan/chitin deacetylase (PgdA/CDA1 family) [Paenibacillus endophyticus]|uniref:Peptidoglycan/xylan/chitin deacetylase (PgdA/CDA1 family) n=1 Tax=Paenibacillus endophyticus TaxID=1294268 RepID=A0A7W5C9J9_9BACL|nr:polysaccharide deacetylase family protein [Paenibacillus endophyticus]MBB3153661.1 peptidoglycan/xylan/chitin deacetylase (PgdA/CDA1 family) [Paenibacillus endophyticus]
MKKARRKARNVVAGLFLTAVMIGVSGCSAGSSFSLSALLSGDKQPQVTGNAQQGPQTGSGTDGDGNSVIVGNAGGVDGAVEHGNLPGHTQSPKPDAQPSDQATEKPSSTVTNSPVTQATATPNPETTPQPEDTSTEQPIVTGTDHPASTPTGKPGATATPDAGNVDPKPDSPATSKPETPEADQLDKPDQHTPAIKPGKGEKFIALTFDDGPDQRYTNDILDILKEKGVKATFFVVGQQVKKNPEVLQRIAEEGHSIGNHTYNHKDLSKLNKQQIIEEIKTSDAAIKKAVGYTPVMVRAPYGAVSDTLKVLLKANNRDLISWNIDTRDWAGTSAADMSKMIKKEAKPNGIILMHSFGSKNIKNTVQALPGIIDDLVEMGYTLVTADQMI